jgi:hypothetical protein
MLATRANHNGVRVDLRAPIREHVTRSATREENQVITNPYLGAQPRELLLIDILHDVEGLVRLFGKRRNGIEIGRFLH